MKQSQGLFRRIEEEYSEYRVEDDGEEAEVDE